MPRPAEEFTPQLRLHPLSWLFALTTSIRQMIIPLVAVLVFGARDQASALAPMLFPALLGLLLVRALWRQWIFRYDFAPHGLVIQEGLIFRNVRQIEYQRIENIDTERGLLHRLFGVADVSVQTSTGGRAEATISVLDLRAVQDMRDRIFIDSARAEAEMSPRDVLLRLPIAELVRYGLIDNRGMILVAATGGVLYEFGLFDLDREMIMAWFAASPLAGIAALGPVVQIVLALTAIASALLAIRVLSVLLAIVTLYDFTLTREDADLRVRHGLLTRVALTLRTARIQALHQTQTLLHRWFDRVSLHADLTGDRGGDQHDPQSGSARPRWLAPVCAPSEALELIAAALPDVDIGAPAWRKLAQGARTRIFRRTLVVSWLLLAAPAFWRLHALGALVLAAAAVLSWIHARLYVQHTAWALTPDALLVRRGWLTRRLAIAPRDRVQSVGLTSSPFDRRWRMASVVVDTAGARAGRHIRVPYLEAEAAHALMKELYRGPLKEAVGG